MSGKASLYPHETLWKNLGEVYRLIEIHTRVAGKKPGFKHNVEVLNKSAIVLLVACWEAFIEDLAETAFTILLKRTKRHDFLPPKVLTEVSKRLKESKDDREIWKLAGEGWKSVLKEHKNSMLQRYKRNFNTPKHQQIDNLYEVLLGIKRISSHWHWQGIRANSSIRKLQRLVVLRGSIAHRVAASQKVHKGDVIDYVKFINRIAVKTSNTVCKVIRKKTGKEPWSLFSYEPSW